MKTIDPNIVGKTIAAVTEGWEVVAGTNQLVNRITFTDGTSATLRNEEWMPGEWALVLKLETKESP